MLNWVRLAAAQIPEKNIEISETAEICSRLMNYTLLSAKKNKVWVWNVVNNQMPGIFKLVIWVVLKRKGSSYR